MGFGADVYNGFKLITTLEQRLKQMRRDIDKSSESLFDHEKRLIRIETMIEMGLQARQAPRIEDE